jgi:cysteine synthase B
MGVGRYLKEQNPTVQVWAIEPPSGEMVDGLRSLEDGYIPPIFTDNHGTELLDRKVVVRPKESIEWTRRMTEVGLFVGISSGAIMAGAVKCANTLPEGQAATIVTIVCDEGWKYLSTGAWSDDVDEVVERAKKIIYF